MHLLSSFLFGLSSSMDAFLIGLTYGVKKYRISYCQQLLISLITLAGTLLSLLLGMEILPFFPAFFAQLTGSSLLILLGLYYLWKGFSALTAKNDSASSHPASAQDPVSGALSVPESLPASDPLPASLQTSSCSQALSRITYKEAVLLGTALSVNNMGMGIGASITGLRLLPTALFTLFFSMAFLFLGNRLGSIRLPGFTNSLADVLSGLLLMGLGVYELFI